MHLLDDFLRTTGPVTSMGKWVRLWAPDENLNFGTVWVKLQSHTSYPYLRKSSARFLLYPAVWGSSVSIEC